MASRRAPLGYVVEDSDQDDNYNDEETEETEEAEEMESSSDVEKMEVLVKDLKLALKDMIRTKKYEGNIEDLKNIAVYNEYELSTPVYIEVLSGEEVNAAPVFIDALRQYNTTGTITVAKVQELNQIMDNVSVIAEEAMGNLGGGRNRKQKRTNKRSNKNKIRKYKKKHTRKNKKSRKQTKGKNSRNRRNRNSRKARK